VGLVSGGAYEYLCWAADDFDQLMSKRHQLREMAERLTGLPYARDAAIETERLAAAIDRLEIQVQVRAEALADVWRAVEWWDSCDWTEDRVHQALAKYRGDEPKETE
jgi:hypothetical protein